MRPTTRLYEAAVRITLFTRPTCSLCVTAQSVLSSLRARRPFSYREVDIGMPEAKGWRDLYDFDVPVVCETPEPNPPLFFGSYPIRSPACLLCYSQAQKKEKKRGTSVTVFGGYTLYCFHPTGRRRTRAYTARADPHQQELRAGGGPGRGVPGGEADAQVYRGGGRGQDEGRRGVGLKGIGALPLPISFPSKTLV